ncbi:MAG: SsrA-binding protein [Myxococcota bacterium]|nr:SsrA-binding protein [Myxococcota bacterium]
MKVWRGWISSSAATRRRPRATRSKRRQGELWLHKAHIAPYEQGGPHFNHEPKRSRKLLAHKREIERLAGKLATKGYSLVPLQLYFKNGHAKVQLGLGKGRKVHDDRETIKRQVDLREARESMKER